MIEISIVITTHKRDRLFEKTLKSLATCTIPKCSIKLIVIENGYKGNVENICKKINLDIPIYYYYLEDPGTSNSRKYSLNIVGDNQYIIFFDDDITFQKEILISYFKAFQEFGTGYYYGGPVFPDYEVAPNVEHLQLFPNSVKGFTPFDKITIIKKPLLLGANWAIHSSDILLAGNFDSDLGPGGRLGAGGHEYDLQERLLKKKIFGVYLPIAGVWHYIPKETFSSNWLKKRWYKNGLASGLRMSRKNYTAYIGNIPRWYLKEFLRNSVMLLICALRQKRDLNYYLAKRDFYHSLGGIVFLIKAKQTVSTRVQKVKR